MLDFSTIGTVLFDMDGVIYRGLTPLPGVAEMLTFCAQESIPYACITNNASKTRQQFEHKLTKMGLDIPGERVFSSAMVTGHYLRATYPRGTSAYMIGMSGLEEALFGDGYLVPQEETADLVVQGIDLSVTYDKFRVAALAIQKGAHFILTNPDKAFPSEDGLHPGAGALAAFIQAATNHEPFVVGKPQPTLFRVAIDMLEAEPAATLVIGDRLETDIAGARNAGLKSAVVLTGVTTREHLETSPHQPDGVFDGLPELLTEWKRSR